MSRPNVPTIEACASDLRRGDIVWVPTFINARGEHDGYTGPHCVDETSRPDEGRIAVFVDGAATPWFDLATGDTLPKATTNIYRDAAHVIAVLQARGGHFHEALAQLLTHADSDNLRRAYLAWPEIWHECVRRHQEGLAAYAAAKGGD